MPTFAEKLRAAMLAATPAGGKLTREQADKIMNDTFAACSKEKKKAAVAEGASDIYDLFPKHVGKEDALKAITKALEKHPKEYLMDKTNQFRVAVEAWPSSYRYFTDGGDRCPHPATWYNGGRFADDPKEWRRAGSRNAAPAPTLIQRELTSQQIKDAEELRAHYREMKEPEKGTLAWALWKAAQAEIKVAAMMDHLTGTPKQVEDEQRLRHA